MSSISTTKPISLVVPMYYCHPKLYLIIDKFFNSLKEHYPELKLIVIDDGSPLPIPSHWPVTKRNAKNLGFTATVNKGLELAFMSSEFAIIANDDLEFKAGDLDKFFEVRNEGIYFPSDTASGNLDTFGSIWGITRDAWKKIGKLDEKYKHFYSDRDYYERAIKAKVPITHWKDITITHHESATYNLTDKEKLLKADEFKFKA